MEALKLQSSASWTPVAAGDGFGTTGMLWERWGSPTFVWGCCWAGLGMLPGWDAHAVPSVQSSAVPWVHLEAGVFGSRRGWILLPSPPLCQTSVDNPPVGAHPRVLSQL